MPKLIPYGDLYRLHYSNLELLAKRKLKTERNPRKRKVLNKLIYWEF